MNKAVLITVILALCAIGIRADICTSGEPLTPAGEIFCAVYADRRDHFVIHYLTDALTALGHIVHPDQRVLHPRTYFGVHPPEDFAGNMLTWAKETTGMTEEEIAQAVSYADPYSNSNVCTNVCFDNATCNPDKDIGCTCCPW